MEEVVCPNTIGCFVYQEWYYVGGLEDIKPNLHMCLWSIPNPALCGKPILSQFSCFFLPLPDIIRNQSHSEHL